MIEANKRQAIYELYKTGNMSARALSMQFKLSRNTIRKIIREKGQLPAYQSTHRQDERLSEELLGEVYKTCQGYAQRTAEVLLEEYDIRIGYSTLTRLLRKSGISQPARQRCDSHPDIAGEEMQHDTTVHTIKIGDKQLKLTASLLYYRYSKTRYLKYYPCFTRFQMKCFFHEALLYWGYSAKTCIIDNTNLARLCGIGKNALIAPEMQAFAKTYGFTFICHERNHPNRKAGEERSFRTVETNFLPGREFASLEDLNAQALHWASERMHHRSQTKAKIIPAKAFEHEQAHLIKLPKNLPAPYKAHTRQVDEYGYIALNANYYWTPGKNRPEVTVLEYASHLEIFQNRQKLIDYPLACWGRKQQKYAPAGQPKSRFEPKGRRKDSQREQQHLRAIAPVVGHYIDYILEQKGIPRHQTIRKLYALSRQIIPELFIKSIERAHHYQVTSTEAIRKIAGILIAQQQPPPPLQVTENNRLHENPNYQEGALSDLPDLSIYE